MVWIFTPRLPWTVVGFVTHCQRLVNGLEINVKTNTIFFKLIKFVNIVVAEFLLFRSILWGDSTYYNLKNCILKKTTMNLINIFEHEKYIFHIHF